MKSPNKLVFFTLSALIVLASYSAQAEETSKTSKNTARARLSAPVQISKFYDVRPKEIPSTENDLNEYSQPKGDIENMVTTAISKALQKQGFKVVDRAHNLIRGEIQTWRLALLPGAQHQVQSDASLLVEVVSESGQVLYTKIYRGSHQGQGKDQKQSSFAIGLAMDAAVREVVRDQGLRDALLTK